MSYQTQVALAYIAGGVALIGLVLLLLVEIDHCREDRESARRKAAEQAARRRHPSGMSGLWVATCDACGWSDYITGAYTNADVDEAVRESHSCSHAHH